MFFMIYESFGLPLLKCFFNRFGCQGFVAQPRTEKRVRARSPWHTCFVVINILRKPALKNDQTLHFNAARVLFTFEKRSKYSDKETKSV